MKLTNILQEITKKKEFQVTSDGLPTFYLEAGNADQINVEGVSYDYQQLEKDYAYLCLENEEFPRHFSGKTPLQNLPLALAKKPSLLVSSSPLQERGQIPWLRCKNIELFSGYFAQNVYQNPFKNMLLLGITGSKGKTTSNQMFFSVLEAHQLKPAAISSIGNFFPHRFDPPSYLSNPLPSDIYSIGAQALKGGAKSFVMEITSHGATFERNSTLEFDAIMMTNLTSDHLDFHKTEEAYHQAKLQYFYRWMEYQKNSYFIVNFGDPKIKKYFLPLLAQYPKKSSRVFSYGVNVAADYSADILHYSGTGSRMLVRWQGKALGELFLPFPGLFNVSNALGVIASSLSLGLDWKNIQAGLEHTKPILGRFERIKVPANFSVYIDYAHTTDSLENILQQILQLHQQRIIVVFGCGGDRDKTKRPMMGEVAARLADVVFVTNDNPRSEAPASIVQDILRGVPAVHSKKVQVVIDRKEAIKQALQTAQAGDALLIAGKGHETYQIIGNEVLAFSDHEEVFKFFSQPTPEGVEEL